METSVQELAAGPAIPLLPGPAAARLSELLADGGPVLAILLVLSLLAATLFLLKLFQLVTMRVYARGFVADALTLWQGRRPDEALERLAATPNPIAPVLAAAMRGLGRPGGEATPAVREEVLREAAAQQQQLLVYRRGLDLVATLAPLLGLLGTVLGMIEAFGELEAAAGRADPGLLAGGIREALLTTAAGLAIALPAAAAVHWVEGVAEKVRQDTEDAVTRIFTGNIPPQAAALSAPSSPPLTAPSSQQEPADAY